MDIRKGREDWVDQYGGFWNSTELALIWTRFLAVCHTQETRSCVSCWHYLSDVCSSNPPSCSSLTDSSLRNPSPPKSVKAHPLYTEQLNSGQLPSEEMFSDMLFSKRWATSLCANPQVTSCMSSPCSQETSITWDLQHNPEQETEWEPLK